MSSVYASPQDIADRWRPLTAAETATAVTLLQDASSRVRRRFPRTDARIASGDLLASEVTAVVAGMVKRALISGDREGVTQESDTAGAFNRSRTYANPLGNLFFHKDDLAVLDDAPARRAFAVDLTPGA